MLIAGMFQHSAPLFYILWSPGNHTRVAALWEDVNVVLGPPAIRESRESLKKKKDRINHSRHARQGGTS